ncbi:NAD(P)H-dependent oxidoreductase [Asticcacaulis sp. BYS171W]|uniref:NAD(P)H-dependent oxidoreductase n=1 Tax=Asticcacaulis aquaticus TaxID=2984212 RepID=A0ABT5HUJ4_9CAUL|nr:NAD(P)H-dependent oxidoreductase [Asticcacaulis aquaticus]MDC7683719.1 NAD(P)H-dependent oxidoreductase [Asticcacaulis aquaticus]
MPKIAVLIGSLRRDSINKKYAHALEKLAGDRLDFHYLDVDLPLYNEDLWENPPEKVVQLKADIEAADGVLIVTPEYNRSVPPCTKNAIDWASRPYGHNSWKGKPVAITGASPGRQGTAVSQSQLRSTLVICETVVMGGPEVYMTFTPDLLTDDGTFASEGTQKFLNGFIDAFVRWVERP